MESYLEKRNRMIKFESNSVPNGAGEGIAIIQIVNS